MAETMQNRPAETPENSDDIDNLPLYRKKRIIIPVIVFVLAALAAAWYWYVSVRGTISTDDAFIDGDKVSVSSKMLGRIEELKADEGDTVHSGEVIVRLDKSDLLAQEAQAKAAVSAAETAVDPAVIAFNKAEEDFARAEAEFKGGVTTKEQHDHARNALASARAEKSVAVSRVATARAQLGVIESQIRNTTILCPIDGIVAKRWALAGDVVQPGQPIFTVYASQDVWVTANFEETRLGELRQGDSVEIHVDAYPDLAFSGHIFQMGSYAASQFSLIPPNNASGNFTKVTQRIPIKVSIRCDTPGQQPALLPGMSVEVKIRIR